MKKSLSDKCWSFSERHSRSLCWFSLAYLLLAGTIILAFPLFIGEAYLPTLRVPYYILSFVVIFAAIIVIEALAMELGDFESICALRCALSFGIIALSSTELYFFFFRVLTI